MTRGFTGQEMVDHLGVVNMNGRIYMETGEFASPDPFIFDPANTQSYNRYSYVLNNPLKYVDPSGFDCWIPLPQGTGGESASGVWEPCGPPAPPPQFSGQWASPQNPNWGPGGAVGGVGGIGGPPIYQMPVQIPPPPPPIEVSQVDLETVTVTAQRRTPCTGFAGGIVDFTGGNSNQSFVDDVVNNFVDTNDSVASTLAKTALSLAGGGTAAAGYYGTTPLQAATMVWSAYNSAVRIPGLIGSATPLQLVSTAAATWAINSVLIKGSYNAGVLFGSILRTSANRVAAWSCSKPE